MKSNHVLRWTGRVGEPADRKGRCICGDDRFRAGLHSEFTKDFFLYLKFFRGSLDDELHVAQFHWRGGGDNPRAACFRFLLSDQTTLYGISIGFLNVREAAIDLLPRDVAQN